MYMAKLNPEVDEDEAVHEAIWNALVAGDITKSFGRFWVGDGYIVIDQVTEIGGE